MKKETSNKPLHRVQYTTTDILKEVVTMYKVINENFERGLHQLTGQTILHLYKILEEYPDKSERIPFNGGTTYSFEEARQMLLKPEDLRTKLPVNALGRWAQSKLAKAGQK